MFRIEFFVDEKKLGPALIALMGIAHGQPLIQPVANVLKTANGVKAATGGKGVQRIAFGLEKVAKGTVMDGAQFRDVMKSVGMSPNSSSYCIRQAIDAGLIQKSGKTGNARYTVL